MASRGDDLMVFDLETYKAPMERAAMRAALGTAAGIADGFTTRLHQQYFKRGRLTKEGRALIELSQEIGDAIWAAREAIHVNDEPPKRTLRVVK